MSKQLFQRVRAQWRKRAHSRKHKLFERAACIEPLESRLLLAVVNLSLKNDTGTPGDFDTFDPRVIVSVPTGSGQENIQSVQLDFNQDEMPEEEPYFSAGSSAEFNPAMWVGFGSVTVSARTVSIDETTYEQIYGNWQSLSFNWESALTAVTLTTSAATANEGGNATFAIAIPSDFADAITIEALPRFKGDAQHPAEVMYDFSTSIVSVTSTVGASTVNVPIPTLQDNIDEFDDEEFEVEFSASISGMYYDSITLDVGVATIIDNDSVPQLWLQRIDLAGFDRDSAGNLLTNTVLEDDGVARFNVMFSHPSEKDVDLTFGTQNGTATGIAGTQFNSTVNDEDFELFSGRTQQLYGYDFTGPINFSGGTIEIPLNNDWWHEGTETFSIVGLSATNGSLVASSATVTIDDNADDKPYAYVPESLSVMENSPTDVVIPIRLTNPSVMTVTVNYGTGNSTSEYITVDATPTEDYVSTSGTASFAPGLMLVNVTVGIVDDEPWRFPPPLDPLNHPWWFEEFFGFKLLNPVNARFNDGLFDIETDVAIIDEQSEPSLIVNGPTTINEGGTANLTFSFAQVFEKTEVLNYRVYWDLTDYRWWGYLGGSFQGVCGESGAPPTEWGKLVDDPLANGSITLTPTGQHDFPITVPAPTANGLHDPERYLRIIFEWQDNELEQHYVYDPPTHIMPIVDDTPEPQVISFVLSPNSLYEASTNMPQGRSWEGTIGTVTLDHGWSIPQLIHLDVDETQGIAGDADVRLPGWHISEVDDSATIYGTSVSFGIAAVLDNPEGDESLAITATAGWNGSSATATGTIFDAPYGPSNLPHIIDGTFDVPDDRVAGELLGSIFDRDNGFGGGVSIVSNNGPFDILDTGPLDGAITYTGAQPLISGQNYSLTYRVSDQWNFIERTLLFHVVAGNRAPVLVTNDPLEIKAGVAANASVGFVAATDPNGQQVNYEIDDPSGTLPFTVDAVTGEIRTTDQFNAPAGSNFSVNLVASDNINDDPHRRTLAFSVSVSVVAAGRLQNAPPIALRDEARVAIGDAVLIDVLSNDFDPENGVLSSLQIETNPLNGTATVVNDPVTGTPKIEFTSTASNRGFETFSYKVFDDLGNPSTGNVTVGVGLTESQQGQVLLVADPSVLTWVQPYLRATPYDAYFPWPQALAKLKLLGYSFDFATTVDSDRVTDFDAIFRISPQLESSSLVGITSVMYSANGGSNYSIAGVAEPVGLPFGEMPRSANGSEFDRNKVNLDTPISGDLDGDVSFYPSGFAPATELPFPYTTENFEPATVVAWGAGQNTSEGCDYIIHNDLAAVVTLEEDGVRAVASAAHALAPLRSSADNNSLLWDNAFEWVLDSEAFEIGTGTNESFQFTIQAYAQNLDVVGTLPVASNRSYELVSTTQSTFNYDPVSGSITIANASDLVSGSSYTLDFDILDSNQVMVGHAIASIAVTWPNRAPEFVLPAGPFSLAENSVAGTVVGQVTATDLDPGTTLSFTIMGGNTGNAFAIDSANGQITVANRNALDFETTPVFTLTVRVSDDVSWDILDDSVNVVVNLQDIVVDLDTANLGSIPENSPAGTLAGTITPRDWPPNDSLSYSILQAEDGNGVPISTSAFQVLTNANGRDGRVEIVNPAVLNYESLAPGHIIRLSVRAADNETTPNSDTEWFTFGLTDVNEPPTNLAVVPDNINENTSTSAADVTIGQFATTDEDIGGSYTYLFVSGAGDDDNSNFVIVSNELRVRQGVVLNFEAKPEYHVRVKVIDGPHNLVRALIVHVNDLNESPTNILLAPSAINENTDTSTADVTVGTLSTVDEDTGPPPIFAFAVGLGDTDNGIFIISGNELRIKQGTVIDREAKPQYSVRVNSNDTANNFAKALTVTVNDLNDNGPVIPAGQHFDILEDSAIDSLHGPISHTDADTPAVNPPVTWSLAGPIVGNNNVTYPGVFTVVASTGQIQVLDNSVFDAENSSFPQAFTFLVQVTDSIFVDQEFVTVDIRDVNDNPPVVNPGQTVSVPENATNNSLHGPVTGFDPDVLDVLQNWQIVGDVYGEDCLVHNGVFTIVAATGQIKILDASQINFDNPALPRTYTLNVMVSDGPHPSDEEIVTVQITDLNDNAPVVTPNQSFSVSEAVANGTIVGTVVGTDSDSVGGPLQNWQITSGNTGGVFQINATTGEISVLNNANLDRETLGQYALSITVTDGANPSNAEVVTVNVSDVNDNAPIVTPGQSLSVSEAATNGATVGTVAATDADIVGGPLQDWTIVSGNIDGIFQINSTTGVITVVDNTNLDRETRSSYTLTVRVSDSLLPSANETVTVTITDVNDNDPVVTPNQSIAIPENSANNSLHGPVVATDADIVGSLQGWQIVGDVIGSDSQVHNDVFTIVAATGQIKILDNTKLDYENASYPKSYTFNVTVSDGPHTSAAQNVAVTLTDLNDTIPIIDTPNPTLSVFEDTAVGVTVGTLTATDPDTVGALQNWTILSGNQKGIFALNNSTGVITIVDRTNLDYETQNSYPLSVQVSDGANLSAPKTIFIDILNVVEPPEISVRKQNGQLVVDDSSTIDFGETPVGTPVVFTFEITNHGDSDLDVSSFSAPTGYTLGSVNPSSTIAPGATSTFTITLDAVTPGPYAGPVSFTNTDGNSDGLDEDPFNFDVTGIVASTAEIEVSYLEGGEFQSGGIIEFGSTFAGTPQSLHLLIKNPGEEDLIITWPDPISIPGFSVTVVGTLPDGNGNQVLTVAPDSDGAIVTIELMASSAGFFNGTLPFPSNDFDEGNFSLQLIGRVKPILLPGGEPAYQIVDNGDPGYSEQNGEWGSPQPVGYLGDYRLSPSGNPNNADSGSATWNFSGLVTGRYRVSTTWLSRSLREGESLYFDGQAQFNVFDSDPDAPGANVLTTAILNQRDEPDDFEFDNARWEDIGTVYVDTTNLSIRLYAPNQLPRTRVTADAVRIELLDVNDDILRLPGGRAHYTFDVRNNDAGNGIDPRAADMTLTGLTATESPKVQTVTTISGSGLTQDPGDNDLWVAPSGTSVRRNPNGTLTYTPADPIAPDVLTFDYALSADPTVVFSFRGESPIAEHDRFFVSHGSDLTFDVRANDFDPQGDALTAIIQGVTDGRLVGGAGLWTVVDASRLAIEADENASWTLELRWDGGAWNAVPMFPSDDHAVLKAQIESNGGIPPGVQVETWMAPFEPRLMGVRFLNMASGTKLEARINPAATGVQLHNRGILTADNDGTFTYAPNESFFRAHGAYTEEFRYVLNDSEANESDEPGFARIDVVNSVPYLTGLDKVRMFFSNAPGASNIYKIPLSVHDADGDPLELVVNYLPGVTPGFFIPDPDTGLIMVEDEGVLFKTAQTGIRSVAYRVFDGHSFSPVFITQLSSLSGTLADSQINDGVPVPMYFDDGSSVDSTGWAIDGHHVQNREVTAAEQIGSAAVDLQTSSFQLVQPLDFDLRQTATSNGTFSLTFNSESADRQPVIQGRLARRHTTLDPTAMTANLTWKKVIDTTGTNQFYFLEDLDSVFNASRTFTNLTPDLSDYLFSVQTPLDGTESLVDRYGNGVYRWQISLDVTLEDNSTKTIAMQGDALLMGDEFAEADPFRGLENGWGIGGLPSLWVELNTKNGAAPWQDNTAILHDPGTESTLFVASTGQSDPWRAVNLNSRSSLPKELGKLTFNDNTNEFVYIDADQTKYTFRYDDPVSAGNTRSFFAALREIDPIIGPNTTFAYHPDGRINTITAADGSITTFVYSGQSITQIQQPGGRNLNIAPTTSGGNDAVQFTIGNYVRTIVYNSSNGSIDAYERVTADISGTGGNQIETRFGYANGYLNQITLGNAANGGTSDYLLRSGAIFTQDAQAMPSAFKDQNYTVAELVVPTGDIKKYDGTTNGADLGYQIRKYYKFDHKGRNVESLTHTTTADGTGQHQLTGIQISKNSLEWDHFDHVVTSRDSLERETRFTYDYGATGPTFFNEQYLEAFSSDPNGPPPGDVDTIFGNLTEVFRLYRQAGYDYEDEFGLLTDEVDAAGNHTRYFRDVKGRTHFVDGVEDFYEVFNYGTVSGQVDILTSYTDTLGLTTVTSSVDVNRRPTQHTRTDSYAAGETSIVTYDYSNPDLDKVAITAGSVRNATEIEFDSLDRVIRSETLVSPSGASLAKSTVNYGDHGLVTSRTNGVGVRTDFAYDGRGYVKSVTAGAQNPAKSETTTTTYYFDGSIREVTTPDGTKERTFHDPENFKQWSRTDRIWMVDTNDNPAFGEMVEQTTSDIIGNVIESLNLLTGQLAEFEYDPLDRLVTRRLIDVQVNHDPAAPKVDLVSTSTFDALGNLLQARSSDAPGIVTDYDGLNEVTRTEVIEPNGAIYSYETDPAGNVVQAIEHRSTPARNGNSIDYNRESFETNYEYDESGRLRKQTDPDSRTITHAFAWNTASDRTDVTIKDRNDVVSHQFLDGAGLLRRNVDVVGAEANYTYDLAGNLKIVTLDSAAGETNAVHRKIEYGFDDLGRNNSTKQIDPGGTLTTIEQKTEYINTAADGAKVIITAPNSAQTETTTDALGKPIQVTYPAPGTGANGTPDHGAPITQFEYKYLNDGRTEVRTIATATSSAADPNPISQRSIRTENALGWTLLTTDIVAKTGGAWPTANVLGSSVYDKAGRVKQQKDMQNHITSFVYDSAGNLKETKDARQNEIGSAGKSTQFLFDSAGRRVLLEDTVGNVTTWIFDELGRVAEETIQLEGGPATRQWEYDGLVVTYQDRNDRSIVTESDPTTRTTAEKWFNEGDDPDASNPIRILTYVHNMAGDLADADDTPDGATTPDSSVEFTFNSLGQVDLVTHEYVDVPSMTLDYDYFTTGQREKVVGTAGTFNFTNSYSYDALNRTFSIEQSGTGVTDKSAKFTYKSNGTLKSIARNETTAVATTVFDYYSDSRLKTITHSSPSDPTLHEYEYSYDSLGRLIKIDSSEHGLTTYKYDAVSQITESDQGEADANDTVLNYDANGNRVLNGYAVGMDNRLNGDPLYTYEYDAEGNRTRRTARTFSRIVDDSYIDGQFEATPVNSVTEWLNSSSGGVFGSQRLNNKNDGSSNATATWRFADLAPGTYELAMSWNPLALGATLPMEVGTFGGIFSGDTPQFNSASINFSQSPSGNGDQYGTKWRVLGQVTITGVAGTDDSAYVKAKMSAVTGGTFMVADAVRLTPVGTTPLGGQQTGSVDDADSNVAFVGTWNTGGGYHASAGTSGTSTAIWTIGNLAPGEYRISFSWPTTGGFATKSPPILIYDSGYLSGAGSLDQTIMPNDFNILGTDYESLGVFTVANGALTIVMADDHNYTQHSNFVADQILVHREKAPIPQTDYTWDNRNRLIEVSVEDDIVLKETDYFYDALNRRIGKDFHFTPSSTINLTADLKERYVYDGPNMVMEVGTSANDFKPSRMYLNGPGVDQLMATEEIEWSGGVPSSDDPLWTLGDHQNSIRDLFGDNGSGQNEVLQRINYDTFGRPSPVFDNLDAPDLINKLARYTGREFDHESGLNYHRARYVDGYTGQFISQDPAGFSAGDTNLYRYAFNSPANFTDASGRAINLVAGGIGAAVGAVVGGAGYLLFTDRADWTWSGFGASVGIGAAAGGLAGLTFGLSLAATGTGFGGFVVASTAAGTVGGATAGGLNAGVQTGFTDAGAIAQGAGYGAVIGGVGGLTFGVTAGAAAAFLPFGGVAGGAISFGIGGVASDVASQFAAIGLGVQHGGYDWRRTAFGGVVGAAGGAIAGRFDPKLLNMSGTGSIRGIGNALQNPFSTAGRFIKNAHVVRWLRSPKMVGPKTLQEADVPEIQRIAEKYRTRIDVGGSRARGEGRNIAQHDFPADKGPGTRSDIDFIMDLDHPQYSQMYAELSEVGGGAGGRHLDAGGLWKYPNVPEELGVLGTRFRFEPGQAPKVLALPVPQFSRVTAGASGATTVRRYR